jgi:hypothetical protein
MSCELLEKRRGNRLCGTTRYCRLHRILRRRNGSEIELNKSQIGVTRSAQNVTSTALQASNTPRLPAFLRKSAPASTSQRSPTPRNLLLHLPPATILQQTTATRPPPIPCERRPLTSSLPSQFPAQRKTSLTFCLSPCVVHSVPGLAFSWSASAVLGCGPHFWPTPPT